MSPSKQPPSTSSMEWTSVSIGANKLPIRTPVAPSISAETNLKARAFDYFMAQVGPMSTQFSSSEIIASAGEVFSLSTSAAHGLANDITEKVRATMFHVKYLTPVGFFQRNGDAVEVDLDPAQRKEGITYFTVSVTIEPSKIHECFREAKSPSKTIEYTMRLPQTSSSSAIAAPGGNDGDSGGTSVDDGDDEAHPFSTPTRRGLSSAFDAAKSPQMAALINNLSDKSTGLTYRDQLDFLDHQREFTRVFSRKPHIFELRQRHPHAKEEDEDLSAIVTAYFNRLTVDAFFYFYRKDYVGEGVGIGAASEETIDMILDMRCEQRGPGRLILGRRPIPWLIGCSAGVQYSSTITFPYPRGEFMRGQGKS